jgi:hypothetical protein
VSIDADVLQAPERHDQDQVRGFPADPRQRQQLVHRRRHAAVKSVDEDSARRLQMTRFVAIEADRIDQPFDVLRGEPGDQARRARNVEQPGRCRERRRILRAGRQQRRDENLKGILFLALRDLLDGR